MRKEKRGLLFVFLLVVLLVAFNFVYAQDAGGEDESDTESEIIEGAYTCLKEKIGDDCSDETAEEQAFALLALGDYKNCREKLFVNSRAEECWPRNGCKLRETSIALMALNNIGRDTDKIETWLSNQNKTATQLTWYLQIDADEATSCIISYDGSPKGVVNIGADRRLDSDAGNCLKLAKDGYWLEIDSSCLEKEFSISCDKDFKTNLLYEYGDVTYISSITNENSAGGTTKEKPSSQCFKQGASCNYEGSLWAAMALFKKGISVSPYLPYLTALAPENSKYFPDTFLYILTRDNEYYDNVLNTQQIKGYWHTRTYSKYYDTSLAFLALQGSSPIEADIAKNYLLENIGNDGCWDGKRDTAFLLYAGWEGKRRADGLPPLDYCEDFGYYCENRLDCIDAGGEELPNFICSGTLICCSVDFIKPRCSERGGYLCSSNQVCEGNILDSSDTGTCCDILCSTPTENECEQQGYSCRYDECFSDEEQVNYACDYPEQVCCSYTPFISECEEEGYVCRSSCGANETTANYSCESSRDFCCKPKEAGIGGKWWLWILIILILLVIIGIIFKNKLRAMLFKKKRKYRRGPAPTFTRPPFYPPGGGARRPVLPIARPARTRRPPSKTEKELDETLKKLKEMSK